MGHDHVTTTTKPPLLNFKTGGIEFWIKPAATRGDQYRLNTMMSDQVGIKDGKVISVPPDMLHVALIKIFVDGWDHKEPWSFESFENMPATPGEDAILTLGSYIFNHVVGIRQLDEGKKKG